MVAVAITRTDLTAMELRGAAADAGVGFGSGRRRPNDGGEDLRDVPGVAQATARGDQRRNVRDHGDADAGVCGDHHHPAGRTACAEPGFRHRGGGGVIFKAGGEVQKGGQALCQGVVVQARNIADPARQIARVDRAEVADADTYNLRGQKASDGGGEALGDRIAMVLRFAGDPASLEDQTII